MSEALRDEELAMIVFCLFYSHMPAISRGAFAKSTVSTQLLPTTYKQGLESH